LLLIFTDDIQMGIVCPLTQAAVSARFPMKQAVSSIVPTAESFEITRL
jgi:hypothetical protein